MKAVDFIAESRKEIVFIEIKDPDKPSIPATERKDLINAYKSESKDFDLKYKFRDSFLYEWACGRVHKPIHYWVLLAVDSFSTTQLGRRTDALRSKIPVVAALPNGWKRSFAEDCIVFNIRTWNRNLDGFQAVRISSQNQSGDSSETT